MFSPTLGGLQVESEFRPTLLSVKPRFPVARWELQDQKHMSGMKREFMEIGERRRHAAVLGDLLDRSADVFCWCNRCGHEGVVPTARLIAQLGPEFPVPDVGIHVRCTGCGSKDIATRPA